MLYEPVSSKQLIARDDLFDTLERHKPLPANYVSPKKITDLQSDDFEDKFIVTYLSDEVLDTQITLVEQDQTTQLLQQAHDKEVAANPDLNWLLPENDPVPPKSRQLTERQQDVLIRMYMTEREPESDGVVITQGANNNNFYKRLQARRLLVLVECFEGYRGVHCMKWQLTHMGRSIVSGLLDLPF